MNYERGCVIIPDLHIFDFILQDIELFLQEVEEAGGVGAVHLGVVELEGEGEGGLEPVAAVFSPYQEGVVENTTVHAYRAVYLIAGKG